jgi:GT2 family glycosyltransferase
MKNPIFSIIIPVRSDNDYLKETISEISKQTFKSFELLIIDDKISGSVSPAIKRNIGAKKAKGEYLAFLDDDSYPDKNWLKNTFSIIEKNDYSAICGPCLTPKKDNSFQKASGLVWSSLLGSGGAGIYRNSIQKPRFVDDYPSVNLIVNKKDFDLIKGFDTHHWPGEDTILCLNLTNKLNKKIFYHPSIVVYHHRRSVIIHHLQQITRYALHRGLFSRIYPKTSFKIGYLIPSIFTLYLVTLIFVKNIYYSIPVIIYLILLIITLIQFAAKNNIFISFMAAITIPITHIYYGILFIIGFFKRNLDFVPHETNKKTGNYIGG